MSAEQFVAHARTLLGASWRHRGRKPWAIDCIGLVALSALASGLSIRDESDYGREPWDDRLRKVLVAHFGKPISDSWKAGDVALIRWDRGEPTHVAIIADYKHGGLSLIHCENINGCVEHGLSGIYLDAIIEVYRPWPVKFSQ